MKSGDISTFIYKGIVIEGVKYTFLSQNGPVVYAKNKEGKGALTIQKTNFAVIIGHTPEQRQQKFSNIAIGNIANYLQSNGI